MVKPHPALVSALVITTGLATLTGCKRPPSHPPNITPPSASKPSNPPQNSPSLDHDQRRSATKPQQEKPNP
jgi:hypothetical protein